MIYYFSATGNSRWAAEALAAATGDKLTRITAGAPPTTCSPARGERVGFVFPVHGWRPPKTVRQFIGSLTIEAPADTYTYALCTAGDTIGETLRIFSSDLARRGMALTTATSLIMPNTYVGLPFMDVDDEATEKRKLRQADADIRLIAGDVAARRALSHPVATGRWPRINSRLLGALFVSRLISDRPFSADTALCLRCGRCAATCPVSDIDGDKGSLPAWRHDGNCLTCFSCYHHCPVKAIAFGRRTRGKGQYFFGHTKGQHTSQR